MYQKWLPQLTSCPIFQGNSAAEIVAMLECLRPTVNMYHPGECIVIAGTPLTGLGVVLTGRVTISKEKVSGERVLIAIAGPGTMFGEVAAFAGNRVWPATVMADDASEVLFLPPEKIVNNCQHHCEFHRRLTTNMLGIIAGNALLLNKKLEFLTMKSLREKIAAFLLEQSERNANLTFVLPFDRDELADFLGVSRPSLSRELGRMRDEGLIEFHRSAVKIINLQALRGA